MAARGWGWVGDVVAPWSDRRVHDYGGVQFGRPYPVVSPPPPEWMHDLAASRSERASARRRREGHRGIGVPALVLAALVLPWSALALPSIGGADGAPGGVGTGVVGGARADSGAALASMLLRPSAAVSARLRPTVPDVAGPPVRIVVPLLGVDAAVAPISGDSGTLLPPSDASSIGWWREGREPGAASGTAVLTGHTVHTGGGAFDHLDRLRRGDTVLVGTTRGWVRYAVRRSTSYGKGELAAHAATIFRSTGPGRLVLVTCSKFDGTEYLANTVVYAVPVAGDVAGPVSGPVARHLSGPVSG